MAVKPNQFRSLIAASGQTAAANTEVGGLPNNQKVLRRRPGKRTAPDYVQVGVYIPRQLHNKAKVLLIHEGVNRDFSQLVGDLLSAYLNHQSSS